MSAPLDGPSLLEYRIYSGLLEQSIAPDVWLLAIIDASVANRLYATDSDAFFDVISKSLGVSDRCLDDYRDKNRDVHVYDNHFELSIAHVLIPADSFAGLFEDDEPALGWARFFSRYPRAAGIVRLSRAGLCKEDRQAMLYMEHGCGARCGYGRYVLLEHEKGGWKVRSSFIDWSLGNGGSNP